MRIVRRCPFGPAGWLCPWTRLRTAAAAERRSLHRRRPPSHSLGPGAAGAGRPARVNGARTLVDALRQPGVGCRRRPDARRQSDAGVSPCRIGAGRARPRGDARRDAASGKRLGDCAARQAGHLQRRQQRLHGRTDGGLERGRLRRQPQTRRAIERARRLCASTAPGRSRRPCRKRSAAGYRHRVHRGTDRRDAGHPSGA